MNFFMSLNLSENKLIKLFLVVIIFNSYVYCLLQVDDCFKFQCEWLIHVDELLPLLYLHLNKMKVFKEERMS